MLTRKATQSEEKSRHSELLMTITQQWETDALVRARQAIAEHEGDLAEKIEEFLENKNERYFDLIRVGNFFESIGLLVKQGYLSLTDATLLFGTVVKAYYKIYRPYIYANRDKQPDLYDNFEYLASLLTEANSG